MTPISNKNESGIVRQNPFYLFDAKYKKKLSSSDDQPVDSVQNGLTKSFDLSYGPGIVKKLCAKFMRFSLDLHDNIGESANFDINRQSKIGLTDQKLFVDHRICRIGMLKENGNRSIAKGLHVRPGASISELREKFERCNRSRNSISGDRARYGNVKQFDRTFRSSSAGPQSRKNLKCVENEEEPEFLRIYRLMKTRSAENKDGPNTTGDGVENQTGSSSPSSSRFSSITLTKKLSDNPPDPDPDAHFVEYKSQKSISKPCNASPPPEEPSPPFSQKSEIKFDTKSKFCDENIHEKALPSATSFSSTGSYGNLMFFEERKKAKDHHLRSIVPINVASDTCEKIMKTVGSVKNENISLRYYIKECLSSDMVNRNIKKNSSTKNELADSNTEDNEKITKSTDQSVSNLNLSKIENEVNLYSKIEPIQSHAEIVLKNSTDDSMKVVSLVLSSELESIKLNTEKTLISSEIDEKLAPKTEENMTGKQTRKSLSAKFLESKKKKIQYESTPEDENEIHSISSDYELLSADESYNHQDVKNMHRVQLKSTKDEECTIENERTKQKDSETSKSQETTSMQKVDRVSSLSLEDYSNERIISDMAALSEEFEFSSLSPYKRFLGLRSGDGNPVRHSLLNLVMEEDIPLLLEAMTEKMDFEFEDLCESRQHTPNSIIIRPSSRHARRKKEFRIDFTASPPGVFAYPDETTLFEDGHWKPGCTISFEDYQKICEEERERYEEEKERRVWNASLLAMKPFDPDHIANSSLGEPSLNDISRGVTSRISYNDSPVTNVYIDDHNRSLIVGK